MERQLIVVFVVGQMLLRFFSVAVMRVKELVKGDLVAQRVFQVVFAEKGQFQQFDAQLRCRCLHQEKRTECYSKQNFQPGQK